ncbi:uncharacterized protein ACIBXB_007538 [Morphnus guianensis]
MSIGIALRGTARVRAEERCKGLEDVCGRGTGRHLFWRRPQPQQKDDFTKRLECGLSRTNPGCEHGRLIRCLGTHRSLDMRSQPRHQQRGRFWLSRSGDVLGTADICASHPRRRDRRADH